MGRPLRAASGEIVYHVLNRANARRVLFEDESRNSVRSCNQTVTFLWQGSYFTSHTR